MRTNQSVSTAPSAFSTHVSNAEYLRLSQMARAEALRARHAAMIAFWAKVSHALRSLFSLASVRVAKDLGTAYTAHVKA